MSTTFAEAPVFSGVFTLIDHDGNPVDETTYRGTHVLVFFGFTNCKVVCPRALGKLTRALNGLGPIADRVRPLYITIDPERDTPDVMRVFLAERYHRFTGITGAPEQIAKAKSAFRVFATRRDEPDGGYSMPHSAFTYVLDPQGHLIDHWLDTLEESAIASRLSRLLQE